MEEKNQYVRQVAEQKYEFGFTTDVHTEIIPVGLNEDVVRLISAKKGEPEWMLEFRLKAFRYWREQTEPKWGHVHVPEIDYQAISYYADPTAKKATAPADGAAEATSAAEGAQSHGDIAAGKPEPADFGKIVAGLKAHKCRTERRLRNAIKGFFGKTDEREIDHIVETMINKNYILIGADGHIDWTA